MAFVVHGVAFGSSLHRFPMPRLNINVRVPSVPRSMIHSRTSEPRLGTSWDSKFASVALFSNFNNGNAWQYCRISAPSTSWYCIMGSTTVPAVSEKSDEHSRINYRFYRYYTYSPKADLDIFG